MRTFLLSLGSMFLIGVGGCTVDALYADALKQLLVQAIVDYL